MSSYNPTKVNRDQLARRKARRTPPPGSGVKHSDIMKRTAYSVVRGNSARVATPSGFEVSVYSSKDFSVSLELIGAKNSTNLVVNTTYDRVIIVKSGTLFVITKTSEGPSVDKYSSGMSAVLPKGIEYQLASTGGEEVEFVSIAHSKYQKTLRTLEKGYTGTNTESLENQTVVGDPATVTPPRVRRKNSQAMSQAVKAASARDKKLGRPTNPHVLTQATASNRDTSNTGDIIGVNPMPVIPKPE